MKRTEARDIAFLLVFEKAFRDDTMEEIIADAIAIRTLDVDDFAKKLALLTDKNLLEIDADIEKYLTKWKITRLSKVSLSVLRLAVCELKFVADVPIKVTINEAVELAKKYAYEDDASYINGVLGSFVKEETILKDSEEK